MRAGPPSTAACHTDAAGTPLVVLIHGVGFGPQTLTPVAMALRGHATVVVLSRRGYGQRSGEPPAMSVAEHVSDLFAELDRRGMRRAVVAGISGGATVALAAALDHPDRVTVAVAHEPAVGSVSPELRALIRQALSDGGGLQLMRFLAGPLTWNALPATTLDWLSNHTSLIESDAGAFATFEPSIPPPGTSVPLLCSVGERSSATRWVVAERLSHRTGSRVVGVPACAHLPQLDAPERFAELILTHALAPKPETQRTPR